jgi:hypothetical protein
MYFDAVLCRSEAQAVRVRKGHGEAGRVLHREAVLLGRARHPGVEELLGQTTQGDTVEVVTAFVSGAPAPKAVSSVTEVAGVMTVLATTVADLHDIGIVHGAVGGTRVIVGRDGRPVLVGFEQATALDGPPGRWPTSPLAAADTQALGALMAQLLEAVGAAPVPVRGSLVRLRRREPAVRLFVLADRASLKGGRTALTARALADGVLAAVPAAGLPGCLTDSENGGDHDAGPHDPSVATPVNHVWSNRRENAAAIARASPARLVDIFLGGKRWSGALAAGAVMVGVMGLVGAPLGCGPRAARAQPRPGPAPSLTNAPAGSTSFAAGVLTVGTDRFALGGPGDAVVLGRWTCGRSSTVALLRSATGNVWVFPRWPAPGAPVRAVAAGHVAGFVGARSVPAGRCDDLLITRADGTTVRLRPRPAA